MLFCQRMAGPSSEDAAFSTAVADIAPAFANKAVATPARVDPWCRAFAWGAMLAGSIIPMIYGRFADETVGEGFNQPLVVAGVARRPGCKVA